MGKTKVEKEGPGDESLKEITINLFGPGMTALHKAGLAGLWMTLKALEKENQGKASLKGGSWERTPTSVTLRWKDMPGAFFKELFECSFKIDRNGLIWFPALGEPMNNPQHAVILQEAILGSFLQHGQTRKSDKSSDPGGNISIELDEGLLPLKFHRVLSYTHQESEFSATTNNSLAGWHLPGGAVRHTGHGQKATALEETPERALALRFGPIGVIYFEMRSRGGGVRPHYALVIPEIFNLEKYANARECFLKYGVQQLFASGTAEAGFRVLAELKASDLLPDVQSSFCRVISFGTVPWASQQKTRINLMTVQADSETALRTFNFCRQQFNAQLIRPPSGEPFWDVPQIPDLVAKNLSYGREWWEGFTDFVADSKRRDHVFGFRRDKKGKLIRIIKGEKGGLINMMNDKKVFKEGPERTFVLACHEAWRRRMGKLFERARNEGTSAGDLINREFERLRIGFSRCKNATSLREAVTDFWARGGGSLKPLQEGWIDILPLLDEQNWRKGKDLVLLALASYKPANKEEQVVMQAD
jgi:CRISPR-associated protein Cas8a1/Csx13